MHHVKGEHRNQFLMMSLESSVAADSFVRAIDAFVDSINLKSFGFKNVDCGDEGRPPFHPSVLLKLYLYGYKYGIRTSRKLEREAKLNIEAMWLLSGQQPRYHTIADFRKQYNKEFRAIFRRFVYLLKEWELIGCETVGVDSFKIRAQNSLKNNYNEKKIERHLEYIDEKITEYERALDASDNEEEKAALESKITHQKTKQENYFQLQETLLMSGEEQISLTDADAKAVILHRNIVNVGYNVQTSIDSKNKLIVTFETGQVNDTRALSAIAIESKKLLQVDNLNVLADKGYHTGEEIKICQENEIITYVSPKSPSTKDIGLYPITLFVYDKENDTYTCPGGSILCTNGNWYKHSGSARGQAGAYKFKRYVTSSCKGCIKRDQCTGGERNGRAIDRSEYADAIEANNQRVIQNPDYYKQRQQIVEHIFGTIKRQRGFTFTLVKGKEKVLGEVGLMFIGYNLGRCVNILGIAELIKALKNSCFHFILIKNRPILSETRIPIFGDEKLAA
jgi:transposase/sorbitol-specific phosphotransferase system component IIA